ncbi:class I SAM-dependent methyltransferase [Paenibacillus sp. FSL H7-0942]|uniref:class I SAM-dependent methyltransferase n=1 Tax=unclassified Paenibacillus TaxID=185978 RepID=UPI00031E6C42|nr:MULTISPECIES: class I SAM-dependent methyltransferase [unclassified Paenibacillus]ETT31389.1 SAM-dependent methyltransferase [Paenibacillus sp. FSL R5-192]
MNTSKQMMSHNSNDRFSKLGIYSVQSVFIILFLLLTPVYYLNKWDFKRHKKRNPFYTSKLVRLQERYPIFYELAMYVQNFPIPRNVYKVLPPLKGDVLQVGCGTGLLNKYLRKQKDVRFLNMDPNINALKLGKKWGRFNSYIHAFIDKPTSLPDHSCDMILFARSFHHIRYHKKAFIESCRLLRDGGSIIIADPVVLKSLSGSVTDGGYMANSSIDGVIWRFTKDTLITHIERCLPPELKIESVTETRQVHVTNYNLFVPQTDIVVVLRKREAVYNDN